MSALKYWDGTTWQTVRHQGGINTVTSLPSGPYDGQEVYYRFAQTVNPVDAAVHLWHLRWDAAATAWIPIGEQTPLHGYDPLQRGTAFGANAWGNTDAADPTVTLPLAGDYRLEWGCQSSLTSATNINQWIGIQIAGVDPSVATGTTVSGGNTASAWLPTGRGTYKANSVAAGSVARIRFYSQTTASTLTRIGAYVMAYPRKITG